MKKLMIIGLSILTIGCMDFHKRQVNLQKMYPKYVITPATSLLRNSGNDFGYEFLMEDTINHQIYAVRFGTWSHTRIADIRNIK